MNADTITFDVMLHDRFVCTLTYDVFPPMPVSEKSMCEFVVSKLPTLRNKPFRIRFNNAAGRKGGKR
jgi:hypothetical protein